MPDPTDDDGPTGLAARFREHFAGEQHLYAHLTKAMADDIDAGGVTARIVAGWEDAPRGAVVQLRLLAGVFREVLRGGAPELVPFYPCLGGSADPTDAWPLAQRLMERSEDALRRALTVAPQTNEPGRSAALLVGLSEAVRRHGLSRVRLLEPGASAGLNLLVDDYRFVGEGWTAGPGDSPCVVDGLAAQGFSPVEVEIVERRGCDLEPVDATTEDGALRLRSFVWPFQLERHRRLTGALDVLRRHPVSVDRATAGAWLEERLTHPVEEEVLTVVWQSITRQYWPATEIERVAAAVARGRLDRPIAHVTLEPPAGGGDRATGHSAGLPLVEVDGAAVARADWHGPPLELL